MSAADRLDWHDPAACRIWLDALKDAARDLATTAEDQTRPPGQRDLGRRSARDAVTEATASLDSLIAHARVGLPCDPPAVTPPVAAAPAPSTNRKQNYKESRAVARPRGFPSFT